MAWPQCLQKTVSQVACLTYAHALFRQQCIREEVMFSKQNVSTRLLVLHESLRTNTDFLVHYNKGQTSIHTNKYSLSF